MMKNLRVFFPIVLLVLLTIVLSSCQSVVPSPGATDNELMIRGKIKMPFTCCTIEEPIFEDETGHYTDSWSVIPEAVVELKDLDDCNNVLSTTFADEDGYYEFDDVELGIYIVTAYCPVPGQKNYVFKDVVVKEDGQFNYAGIPDCDSTSLALILEYLNDCFKNTTCFKMNSDIHRLVKSISADISDMSVLDIIEEAELGTLHEDFGNFIDADDEDLVDLVCNQLMGCCIGPGFTPQPGPPPAVVTYSLTLGVNPEGAGTASGAGDYNANSTANISASANEGWQFVNWTGDATGTNPGTSVLMNGNKSATANFEAIPTYTVTFVAGDNGSITGTAEFPGILSGTAWGDAVTVPTPVPDSGYEFDNWTPTFPETVTADATFTANFKEAGDITINYVANTGGSVNPASETLAPATGVASGSTATADTGYVFVNWTDASDTVVGTDPLFVPAKVGGLNVAATYYANFVGECEGNTPPKNVSLDNLTAIAGQAY
ncbi:MAG: InlB B-repeat-containing protein, partial [Atribacterota bacterium]|nr:InlB B-repeat-containing protein [Atribacterota bacterium]